MHTLDKAQLERDRQTNVTAALVEDLGTSDITAQLVPRQSRAQKYAVTCGGCHSHRMGLYDAFLIKENHIAACSGIAETGVDYISIGTLTKDIGAVDLSMRLSL